MLKEKIFGDSELLPISTVWHVQIELKPDCFKHTCMVIFFHWESILFLFLNYMVKM